MSKDLSYFRNKLLALRNAIDETLKEIGEETSPPSRARRNLKQERVIQFETNMALGTWRKPKQLLKRNKKT